MARLRWRVVVVTLVVLVAACNCSTNTDFDDLAERLARVEAALAEGDSEYLQSTPFKEQVESLKATLGKKGAVCGKVGERPFVVQETTSKGVTNEVDCKTISPPWLGLDQVKDALTGCAGYENFKDYTLTAAPQNMLGDDHLITAGGAFSANALKKDPVLARAAAEEMSFDVTVEAEIEKSPVYCVLPGMKFSGASTCLSANLQIKGQFEQHCLDRALTKGAKGATGDEIRKLKVKEESELRVELTISDGRPCSDETTMADAFTGARSLTANAFNLEHDGVKARKLALADKTEKEHTDDGEDGEEERLRVEKENQQEQARIRMEARAEEEEKRKRIEAEQDRMRKDDEAEEERKRNAVEKARRLAGMGGGGHHEALAREASAAVNQKGKGEELEVNVDVKIMNKGDHRPSCPLKITMNSRDSIDDKIKSTLASDDCPCPTLEGRYHMTIAAKGATTLEELYYITDSSSDDGVARDVGTDVACYIWNDGEDSSEVHKRILALGKAEDEEDSAPKECEEILESEDCTRSSKRCCWCLNTRGMTHDLDDEAADVFLSVSERSRQFAGASQCETPVEAGGLAVGSCACEEDRLPPETAQGILVTPSGDGADSRHPCVVWVDGLARSAGISDWEAATVRAINESDECRGEQGLGKGEIERIDFFAHDEPVERNRDGSDPKFESIFPSGQVPDAHVNFK